MGPSRRYGLLKVRNIQHFLMVCDRSFKTFIFNSEEELKDDPSEEEEKSLVGVPL